MEELWGQRAPVLSLEEARSDSKKIHHDLVVVRRALSNQRLLQQVHRLLSRHLSYLNHVAARQVLRYASMSRREYGKAIIAFWQKGQQAFCLLEPTK